MKALFVIPFVILPSLVLAAYSGYKLWVGDTNKEAYIHLIGGFIVALFAFLAL